MAKTIFPPSLGHAGCNLELVMEPVRYKLMSQEERSQWLFETSNAGILEEMCEAGYFDDRRLEDEVAYVLHHWNFEKLSDDQGRLNEERIYLLMRI
ncbi:hypothetical protein [Mesorhizobium sp. IMUNJ 23232]|uniref:hypothetical protein n=1 Tax=Mesorhizobium sp. IMUNJ 23232 TaxID=3376064 RepID=UPI0037BDDA7D